MIKAQEYPCDDKGESYGPTSVDIVLDNPEIMLRELSDEDPVVMFGPGASDISTLGEGFFLDFPAIAFEPGCIYETDFDKYAEGVPPTVYGHIVWQEDQSDKLVLQYWIYWYFNDFNNKHESDWEGIQLIFDASTIEEALASDPVEVGYAQHEGGERADWTSSKLERDGTHPVVYSSKGSHASYFGSALYIGRRGTQGFGCDNTDGPSDRLAPEVVLLPDTVDDPSDPLAWLTFTGRWGERHDGSFNGPTGPIVKDRWLEPIAWQSDLRSSSVVIPGGDNQGANVIETFCDAVTWGSGVLIKFTVSPLRVIIALGIVALLVRWFVRRTDWTKVAALPIRRRRRAGQIIRAATGAYGRSPGTLVTFGAIYFPAAIVAGLLGAIVSALPLLGDILGVAGDRSGTSLVFAVLAGSLPNLVAFVGVNAMVAAYMDGRDEPTPLAPADAVRLVLARWRDLLSGLLRAFVIVFVLLITIVGIPWGIRQLVRYQFMPQVVMLEGLDGRQGLARSSELVRGRWWHTGIMISLFNGMVAVAGTAAGLVVLLIFAGLPLWVFSAIVTLIYALIVPLTSIAQTLLCGDAIAEKSGAEAAEPVPV